MFGGDKKMTAGALVGPLGRDHAGTASLDSVEVARFEAVVRRSSGRLIQMLDAAFLDRELSVEAAQEAFVQLYLHWDRVGSSEEPEAWLYRVAVNRCKDHRRRLARAAKLVGRLVATSGNAFDEPREPQGELLSVLRRLPPRQRTAAALFYQGDMSIVQISRVMGISEGAVNSHLNRARAALKELLEEQ